MNEKGNIQWLVKKYWVAPTVWTRKQSTNKESDPEGITTFLYRQLLYKYPVMSKSAQIWFTEGSVNCIKFAANPKLEANQFEVYSG